MFDAQAKAAEAQQSKKYPPFQFRGLDGAEYQLPHPDTLTERQGALLAEGKVLDVIREIDEATHDAIVDMPVFITSELAEVWLSGAGEEGKEPAPSSETPSGAAP